MHSTTWQSLPQWLLAPLMDQAISASEAAELFDNWLLTPINGEREISPQLEPACDRLMLWNLEVSEMTRH